MVVVNCRHMVVEEICILFLGNEHNMEEEVDKHMHVGVVATCNEL